MSEPKTLWQIGRPGDGAKEFLRKGAWSAEYDYTVGSDEDSINSPSIPGILTAPEARKPSRGISTDQLNIDFILEQDYGEGQLTLLYNFYGSEADSLFLDGELLTKITGEGEGKLKKNQIPLGTLTAGQHRLSITTSGGKDGKHAIDYLKLQATVPDPIQPDQKEPSMTNNIQSTAVKTTLQPVLVFDSPNDFIDIDSNATKLTGNFTIEAWVYPTYDASSTTGAGGDLGKWVIYSEGETIFYLEDGELKFQKNAPYETISSTNRGITLNDWNHVAVVKSGNQAGETKLYINGVQNDDQTAIPTISYNLATARIGGQEEFLERFFHGKISEVRLWNRPRTQAEIQEGMYHRLRGNESGLTDYFPLSEGSGILAKDRTSNPNNGKICNVSWSQSLIPIVEAANAIEHLTHSTGLEDYGYWWKRVAQDLLPEETKVPFRRGRIWR